MSEVATPEREGSKRKQSSLEQAPLLKAFSCSSFEGFLLEQAQLSRKRRLLSLGAGCKRKPSKESRLEREASLSSLRLFLSQVLSKVVFAGLPQKRNFSLEGGPRKASLASRFRGPPSKEELLERASLSRASLSRASLSSLASRESLRELLSLELPSRELLSRA